MLDAINAFTLLLIVWSVFSIVRVECIYRVRKYFIWKDDVSMDEYRRLPDFDAMAHSPRYYLLWTRSHWQAWLNRHPDQQTA